MGISVINFGKRAKCWIVFKKKGKCQFCPGYKYKESYQLLWSIPKYQPKIEHLLQYPIGLNLVIAFFPLMYKPPIYD